MSIEFKSKPSTIKNIGEEAFISVPLYKRKKNHDVIYINKKLYEEVYKKEFIYSQALEDIERDFSLTLNESLGDKIDISAYIDMQGDPSDIALNGNKGSGRAFYVYENCNVKGDKTPFATSPRDDYSNGKYALDCAIQEGLISNILNSYDEFSNFETLAIIDLDEEYLFPHTTGKLPCGLMVRYAKNNELYRFSHRFINEKIFDRKEIIDISTKIGEMEGNKFIHRILHGAWSIGNLSIESNMIDLDTSFFVKGRHPQWSFTDRFKTNYFGYEYLGQIMVMETILNSSLNKENVSIDEVKEIIEKTRINTIHEGFAYLLGYDKKIYLKYKEKFDELCDEFISLAPSIYDNYDNLNCVDKNCNNTYLFDFSRLFRYYPIFKSRGSYSNQLGLTLLLNGNADPLEYEYDNEEYHDKMKGFFKDIMVKDEEEFFTILSRAIKFINSYDELNSLIDEKENIAIYDKLQKAYIRNEDKIYLMARKWMRGELIDLYHDKGKEACNEVTNAIIEAYSSQEKKKVCMSDLLLFKEGYLYRKINDEGYNRWVFKSIGNLYFNKLILNINGQEIILKSKDGNEFSSEHFKNKEIEIMDSVELCSRDKTKWFDLLGRDEISKQNKKILLK